jgi:Zn-dependent protease with chaperone function
LVLWLGSAAIVLAGLGWTRLVRINWGLQHAILVDDVLILLPVLAPLVLSWTVWHDVDRELRRRMGLPASPGQAEMAQERNPDRALGARRFHLHGQNRWSYVGVHTRHYLGILVVPVLTVLGFQDAARHLLPEADDGTLLAAAHVPALVLLAMLFPSLLRHVWQTRPLDPGPLRDRLEGTAQRAGFKARDILVWNTGGMMLNAAVAGFVPVFRYVFLTDGLLNRLSDEQIQAVFGHEIGHLRYRHLLLRIVAMFAPIGLCLLVDGVFPGFLRQLGAHLVSEGEYTPLAMGVLALGGLAGYLLFVFGPYCRLLEGQADLFGCRALAATAQAEPLATYVSALEDLATAGAIDRERSSWQHASIADRVAFLRRIASDPVFESRFHRRVLMLSGLLLTLAMSPLVCQLLALP